MPSTTRWKNYDGYSAGALRRSCGDSLDWADSCSDVAKSGGLSEVRRSGRA
ncbi:MAG: hypothetical protein R3C56_04320 [Pirellulaceae bacterium]